MDIKEKWDVKLEYGMNLLINRSSLFLFSFFILCSPSFAWDGTDQDGNIIEIEKGNLVRSGLDIEVYDYNAGEYKEVEVQSINNYGTGVEIEVYDYNTGEYHTYDME